MCVFCVCESFMPLVTDSDVTNNTEENIRANAKLSPHGKVFFECNYLLAYTFPY